MPRPLVLEGLCELSETDAGFLPCDLTINGTSVAMQLAQHVGCASADRTRPYALRIAAQKDGAVFLGGIRLTVEFVDDTP